MPYAQPCPRCAPSSAPDSGATTLVCGGLRGRDIACPERHSGRVHECHATRSVRSRARARAFARGPRALHPLSPRRRRAGARPARRALPPAGAPARPPLPARERAPRRPHAGRVAGSDQGDRPLRSRSRDRVLLVRRADDPRRDQALLPRPHVGGPRAARPAGADAARRPRRRRAVGRAAPPAVGQGDRRRGRRRRGGDARGAAGRRRVPRRLLRRPARRRRRGRRDDRRLGRHDGGRLRSRRGARDAAVAHVDGDAARARRPADALRAGHDAGRDRRRSSASARCRSRASSARRSRACARPPMRRRTPPPTDAAATAFSERPDRGMQMPDVRRRTGTDGRGDRAAAGQPPARPAAQRAARRDARRAGAVRLPAGGPVSAALRQVSEFQQTVYFVTLLASAAASALFIAPTAYHRLMFQAGDKPMLVRSRASSRWRAWPAWRSR